jgi:RsiW-degrading membrane proteinase PrsW (M82 family)
VVLRTFALVLAVLLMAVGVLWTVQGLGYVEGSSMSGERTWALVGPLVAGFGLALVIVVVQRSRGGRP